jgi:ankyrin repeat protein
MKVVVALLFVTAIATTATAQGLQIPQDMTMPPLMRAAATGSVDDVRKLLQGGADANEKIEDLGLTTLMVAARRGHVEIVKVLLNAGADPNAAGGIAHVGFYTPLILAMNRNNKNRLEVIDALIAGGASVNPPATHPKSPLDAAINANDIEMIKALLKRASDVNWENPNGHTALVTAITMGDRNVEVVRLLLESGADPNKPRLWAGDDCESILQFLVYQQRFGRDKVGAEIIRLIVQAGGRKYTRKSHGQPCKA